MVEVRLLVFPFISVEFSGPSERGRFSPPNPMFGSRKQTPYRKSGQFRTSENILKGVTWGTTVAILNPATCACGVRRGWGKAEMETGDSSVTHTCSSGVCVSGHDMRSRKAHFSCVSPSGEISGHPICGVFCLFFFSSHQAILCNTTGCPTM